MTTQSTSRRAFLISSLAGAGPVALQPHVDAQQPPSPASRPNIVLILADDMGFSDLGCYGSEIHTPHLDRLAASGLRFSQFYSAARCCPSRAALITGLYPHQAGMGFMLGKARPDLPPGYLGQLNNRFVTLPQVMRDAGYATLMCGKWHLGEPGPIERGFDEFYGFLSGFESFWDESRYTRLPEGRPRRSYGSKFYATDALTDNALDFVAGARREHKPYFLYLAYNAPHFPLHAPKKLIDKYVAVYEKGWDAIREARFARLKTLGLVKPEWQFTPRSTIPPNRVVTPETWENKPNPAWDEVSPDRRADLVRRMATYAAMVEIMDRNIGRLVKDLRANGELDNTLILFLSDNGACAEWDPWGFDGSTGPDNILHKGAQLKEMGQPRSFHSYGSGWANACNTPWRFYKHYGHEGGIASPCIAHWPAGFSREGALEHQPAHLIDLMPTFVELAGAKYPQRTRDSAVPAMEGESLTPAFHGKPMPARSLCWEHEGNRAIREGKWKLVALGPSAAWELYDMEADRTEMNNLAQAQPGRVHDMAGRWEAWAKRTNVLPWIWKPRYQPPPAPPVSSSL
ncbi:MAG: arylsulfatase [Acidobacteriota bacterium]